MLQPTEKCSIPLLDHSKPSIIKTMQATSDCFAIFLNSYSPISTDYSGHFEEVLLGSHEFLQVLSSRLEFETL
jgi:hypothetical protein